MKSVCISLNTLNFCIKVSGILLLLFFLQIFIKVYIFFSPQKIWWIFRGLLLSTKGACEWAPSSVWNGRVSSGGPGAAGISRHESSGSESEQSPTYSQHLPNVEQESLSLPSLFAGAANRHDEGGRGEKKGSLCVSFHPWRAHIRGRGCSRRRRGRRPHSSSHACALVCPAFTW